MSETSETMASPKSTGGKGMKSPILRKAGFESTVSKALAREKFNRHVELLTGEFADVLTLHEAVNAIPERMNSVIVNVPGVGEVPFAKKDFNNLVANFERELLDLAYLQTTVRKVRTSEEGVGRNKAGYYTFVGDAQYPTALSEFLKDPTGDKFGALDGLPLVSALPTLSNKGVAYSSTVNNLFYILSVLDDLQQTDNFVNQRYEYFYNGANVIAPLLTPDNMWFSLDSKNAKKNTYDVVKQRSSVSRAKKRIEDKGREQIASPTRASYIKKKNSKAIRKASPEKGSPKRRNNYPDLEKKDPFRSVSYISVNSLTLSKIEKFRNQDKKNRSVNQVNPGANLPTLTNRDLALFDRVEALLSPDAVDENGQRLIDLAANEAATVTEYYNELKRQKEEAKANE